MERPLVFCHGLLQLTAVPSPCHQWKWVVRFGSGLERESSRQIDLRERAVLQRDAVAGEPQVGATGALMPALRLMFSLPRPVFRRRGCPRGAEHLPWETEPRGAGWLADAIREPDHAHDLQRHASLHQATVGPAVLAER